jgi:hypothetical protein
MDRKTLLTRLALLVLLLELAGCSWFRNRRADDAPEVQPAVAAAAPAVDAAPVAPAAPVVPAPSDAELAAAREVAEDFYEMHRRFAGRGLPSTADMNAYRAFLCPSLVASIGAARVRQEEFVRAHPDQKPPLAEGDLFSSLFEGAETASAVEAGADGAGARVLMALSRDDGRGAVRWRDAVLLSRDDGVWCIADVEYRGDWPFANKGRLVGNLEAPF